LILLANFSSNLGLKKISGEEMNRRGALKALAGLAICPICASAGCAAQEAAWSYEGASGPAHRGDLDHADRMCSVGTQQSPVAIDSWIKTQLTPLKFA
jgi:carbonic anhydrase